MAVAGKISVTEEKSPDEEPLEATKNAFKSILESANLFSLIGPGNRLLRYN
ncbi:hypothetical protein FNV43_RR14223 [Rhamnella rubrinervis]|uniref:Uncharacterized protein n=1 Tax=Rhamnella rubrinervis TaxID=2594499 RepID=A0A8K0MG16_9ROSA|nr:hypothetical protein FNV43_RR14223 [Rhamnella rubrinervis]